jgi:hypothetical protein
MFFWDVLDVIVPEAGLARRCVPEGGLIPYTDIGRVPAIVDFYVPVPLTF